MDSIKDIIRRLISKYRRYFKIIIPVFIIITLYISGFITLITSSSTLLGKSTITLNPFKCILANFTVGIRGLIFILIIYACILAALYVRKKSEILSNTSEDERGFMIEHSGTYGTNFLMGKNNIREYCEVDSLQNTSGIIVGKLPDELDPTGLESSVVSIPPDGKRYRYTITGKPIEHTDENGNKVHERENLRVTGLNRNMMVIASSGGGKSFCVAIPAIFQSILHGESVVVTDPKGELFSLTSEFAKEHGYTVRIFNLVNPENSDSWDALAEAKNGTIEIEVLNMATIIMNNTSNNTHSSEDFVSGEKNLLCACLYYVLLSKVYDGPRTLGGAYDLLKKDDAYLAGLFEEFDEDSPALDSWNTYYQSSDNLRNNLRQGLKSRLSVFQSEIIKIITGTPGIDVTLPGKTKCIYYINISDTQDTFKFISSLFFTSMTNKLMEYARKQDNGSLPVTVNLILDEFIAIGSLPQISEKLSVCRSYHVNIMMIIQSISLLQTAYPNNIWAGILSNCSTMLCFACNDGTTAKYFSERSGTATISTENKSMDTPLINIGNVPHNMKTSYGLNKRAVLTEGDIYTMDPNKILVMRSNANPFYVTKFPWTDLVDKSTIRSVNIYDYAPDWARQKNAELEQRIDSDTPKVSPYGGTSKNNSKEDQSNDETNKNPQSNVPGNKKGGENMNEVDQRNPKPTSNADEESQKVLGEF